MKPENPTNHATCPPHRNSMYPAGRALQHPAANLLRDWATFGCPTKTGKPWSKSKIWEAVIRGPHCLALSPEAIAHFGAEAAKKVQTKQACLVQWDTIKDNPPKKLKILPILAAIPHKSKDFCSVLDLSFRLRLANGGVCASVNNTTEKTAPAGAINQIGKCLSRVIHAFAEADNNAKIFMAKWDIKDGFWRMDCATGEEWNFAYVLPQEEGKPITLVVPTSLQMGWVESPPYFCTATETLRDISTEYIDRVVNSLLHHKFEHHIVGAPEYVNLPETAQDSKGFLYMVEVYVDDFMSLVIPVSWEQLRHIANAIMLGIHNVFPPDAKDSNDPISEKKLKKGEGGTRPGKHCLGSIFDGKAKTMWLKSAKGKKLLTILKGWICTGKRGSLNILFGKFESTIAKIWHAFTSIPAGGGLPSPCNRLLKQCPTYVHLHQNPAVLAALEGCCTLLRESMNKPTHCRELVSG
jgi:hypothetical protein